MKKAVLTLLLSSMILNPAACALAEDSISESAESVYTESLAEEAADQECEWNVLLYLCGTDLESNAGLGTNNLTGIADSVCNSNVNLLVETGGAKEWKAEEPLGMDIATDKLQRWFYGEDGFVLVDEAEEACMSHASTLADFISWAGEHYSAKKNMLVLWDHGGGSCSGLICDENYGDAIMPVYELENALLEGGTHFDLVLTDTCLMANLETAQALAPYADYLVGSEEVLAGEGTNYSSWVNYLYDRPDCSAVQLGKRICDSSQQHYIEQGADGDIQSFTMSLIDLSKVNEVAECFNAFMHDVADLVRDADAFYEYSWATFYADNYVESNMYDIFDLSQRAEKGGISKEVTHALQDAVEDAVVYNLRSNNHMFSHGLSVFYPLNEKCEKLDHYARSCKIPELLAFLDCISVNWTAPSWVYDTVERRPELDRSKYIVNMDVSYSEDDGWPYVTFSSGEEAVTFLSYTLYHFDPESNVMYTLGESGNLIPELVNDDGNYYYRFKLGFDGTWPTLEGKPVCLSIVDDTGSYVIYNIPIEFEDRAQQLRVLVEYDNNELDDSLASSSAESVESALEEVDSTMEEDESFLNILQGILGHKIKLTEEADELSDGTERRALQILGLWDGFDTHTGLPGRNVVSFNNLIGKPFTLYNVVYSNTKDEIADYVKSVETEFSPDTKITFEDLPEGDYFICFKVRDVFNASYESNSFPVHWDGENLNF